MAVVPSASENTVICPLSGASVGFATVTEPPDAASAFGTPPQNQVALMNEALGTNGIVGWPRAANVGVAAGGTSWKTPRGNIASAAMGAATNTTRAGRRRFTTDRLR